MRRLIAVFALLASLSASGVAQSNRIDVVTPLAPELASYGPHTIGVRTIQVTDRNRIDILNTKEGGPTARYDRTLTLEVWYPATLAAGQKPGGDYRVVTRDPAVTATLHGKAVRDAAPEATPAAFPLVIISHGYPGNRFLLSHLAREPGEQGIRRGVDRSQGQHLRRPEGLRQHALQPAVRSAVRAERNGASRPRRIRQFSQRSRGRESHRARRLLDGRLRRGQRHRRRLQQGERNVRRRAAQSSARRSRRRQSRLSSQHRSAHQGRHRDRAVGHAERLLGRRRAQGHHDAGAVRGRQRRRRRGVREGDEGHLSGRPSTPIGIC